MSYEIVWPSSKPQACRLCRPRTGRHANNLPHMRKRRSSRGARHRNRALTTIDGSTLTLP